jgi:hypothetical protein
MPYSRFMSNAMFWKNMSFSLCKTKILNALNMHCMDSMRHYRSVADSVEAKIWYIVAYN